MDILFSKYIEDIKQLVVHPGEFWQNKKEEEAGRGFFFAYLWPFLFALAIAVFVGEFFKRSDFFFQYPVIKAIRIPTLFVLLYFVATFFTKELMKTFGGEKNGEVARKLVAFSMMPLMLISTFTGLIPFFVDLNLLGLYGFYLFWIGAKTLVNLPNEKMEKYILIASFVNFFVFLTLHVFLSKVANYLLLVLD